MYMEQKNTPQSKGIRTALQAVVGSLIGLVLAVWAVPDVPQTVQNYISDHWLPLLVGGALSIGIPSGLLSFFQNKVEDEK
jgi:small basic protein